MKKTWTACLRSSWSPIRVSAKGTAHLLMDIENNNISKITIATSIATTTLITILTTIPTTILTTILTTNVS